MFPKIAAVIVTLGVCACSLLALRQARLQAANELAEARLRVRGIDERVSLVRTEIARHVTPREVEEMTGEMHDLLGPLVPMAMIDELRRARETGEIELVTGGQP